MTPMGHPWTDDSENPFREPFTPSKRMQILRASLSLTSSTSYLVPPFPVMVSDPIIAPQRKEPEAFSKLDWDSLLDPNITYLGEEDLIQKVKDLQAGLMLARDGLRAREAVIKSTHATNVIPELTCQCQADVTSLFCFSSLVMWTTIVYCRNSQ